jgi:replicative superfamily II helicase
VAELLLIRHTVNLKKKCIVILPFVSIVNEKTKHFRKILADEKVEIGCFHSGARAPELWDIAVCTIEKVRSPKRDELTEGQLVD